MISKYPFYAVLLIVVLALVKTPFCEQLINYVFFSKVVCYLLIILFIMYFAPQPQLPGRSGTKKFIMGYAISIAVIFLALNYTASLFMKSLALSPYDLSLYGIVANILDLLPFIVAREMIRAYAFGAAVHCAKKPLLWVVIITLIMFLLDVNFAKLMIVDTTEARFIFGAQQIMPSLLENFLLSALVYYGGAKSAIIYSAVTKIFLRIFPFLPSLPWLAESALGIIYPALVAFFVRDLYYRHSRQGTSFREQSWSPGFLVALLLSIAFVWFSVGVFPIYPSVVLTGSMEPVIYPGDVILIKKINQERQLGSLAVNDVINFSRDNITVTHRIIEVLTDEAGNVSYRTKGDNNDSPDEEIVEPNDLNGIISNVVPKAGWPMLLMRKGDPIPEGVVDN